MAIRGFKSICLFCLYVRLLALTTTCDSSRDVHLPVRAVQVHEETEVHPSEPALQRSERLRGRRGRDRLP